MMVKIAQSISSLRERRFRGVGDSTEGESESIRVKNCVRGEDSAKSQ